MSIPDDNREQVFYCKNCSKVGIRIKLYELYLDKFQCNRCGRIYPRIEVE